MGQSLQFVQVQIYYVFSFEITKEKNLNSVIILYHYLLLCIFYFFNNPVSMLKIDITYL